MSKVRINDLAREMEVKSRQILDILAELGLATGKTHSSSLEDYEADKVRAQFERGLRPAGQAGAQASRAAQGIAPKIDLSHISKPGDVMKAILAKKAEQETEARYRRPAAPVAPVVQPPARPAPPVVTAAPSTVPPARPEPRRIFPQPRSAPPIIAVPPVQPAIASRPPVNPVVAKAPAGAVVAAPRPAVAVAPPAVAVVAKPPAAPVAREVHPRENEEPKTVQQPDAPAAPTVATPDAVTLDETTAIAVAPIAPAAAVSVAEAVEPAIVAASPAAEAVAAAPPQKETASSAPASAPTATVPATPEHQPVYRAKGHTHIASPTAALPARRVVMPQTGPRPVYKAPPVVAPPPPAPNTGNAAGIRRGQPIFDRGRTGGPGSYAQRTPGAAPGPVPRWPASQAPHAHHAGRLCRYGSAGSASRLRRSASQSRWHGWRRADRCGAAPAARPCQRPRRSSQQYPKTKEGPMKGFVPPPRYGGVQYGR